jgi:hypothetical protein
MGLLTMACTDLILKFRIAMNEFRSRTETNIVNIGRMTLMEVLEPSQGSREVKSFDMKVIISPRDRPKSRKGLRVLSMAFAESKKKGIKVNPTTNKINLLTHS